MNTPIIAHDFAAQWELTRSDVLGAVDRVGKSGYLILGSEVKGFEAELAPRFGTTHAVGVANGLDALEIALRAAGLVAGDRVLTTPMSAFATTLAIIRAGGVPVFVDTEENGLLDLSLAEQRLAKGDIRFMMPVHLYGHALDLERLRGLHAKYGVCIIEDCAQSIGAKSRGVLAGSVGALAATSFYPTKNLGCLGDGGAMMTSDDALAAKARALRDYGQSSKYVHDALGLNSRLDELQAAVLRSALLPKLDEWTRRRTAIAQRYLSELSHTAFSPLPAPAGSESVWHLFPLRVAGQRDAFLTHLRSHGVHAGVHYPRVITDQEALRLTPFEVFGTVERAKRLADVEVSIPVHPFLSDAQVSAVIAACNSWRP